MAHDLPAQDDLIPIQQRGQELVDALRAADDAPPPPLVPKNEHMPRIGIALGGGSARGLSHIPFIEAMDELGLRPSVISGTSIGALIGSGSNTITSAPWLFYFPAAALTLLTTSMALVADGLRDAFDPTSNAGGQV